MSGSSYTAIQNLQILCIIDFNYFAPTAKCFLHYTTTTTVLRPIYKSTCISQHLQLRTGAKFYCPHAFQHIQIREKTLKFSSTVLSTLSSYLSFLKRELLDTVKARTKQGSCLEKEIMQGTMPGARRRGRPHTAGWTISRHGQVCPWKSQSEWQRTEINGESTSMVWPTLGSRTAKNRTVFYTITVSNIFKVILMLANSLHMGSNQCRQYKPCKLGSHQ